MLTKDETKWRSFWGIDELISYGGKVIARIAIPCEKRYFNIFREVGGGFMSSFDNFADAKTFVDRVNEADSLPNGPHRVPAVYQAIEPNGNSYFGVHYVKPDQRLNEKVEVKLGSMFYPHFDSYSYVYVKRN